MNKDLHDIDDLFRNSIEGHMEEVPPDVWKDIDHNLDKKQVAFYKRRYFTVRAAAILVVLIGGVTIAAILHLNQKETVAPEYSRDQSVVTTSRGHVNSVEKKLTQNEEVKDFINDEKRKEQNAGSTKANEERVEPGNTSAGNNKKGNSTKFDVASNDTYSAEQSKEVSQSQNRKNATKERATIKYKPVTKSSVDLVINKQNALQESPVEKTNSSIVEAETFRDVQRTTYIDRMVLDFDRTDLSTSIAERGLSAIPSSFQGASNKPVRIKVKSRFNHWSISPMFAWNVNLNTLKDDEHFRDPRNNSREAKRTEQETISFTTGLGVQRQISRNVFLQSGVQYFSSKTSIEPKTIFAEPDARGDVRFRFSCSSGESYLPAKTSMPPVAGDSIKTNFSESKISYLQVPLLVAYQISFGKFSFIPSVGVQTNFLLSGKLNSFLKQPGGEEEVSSSLDGLRSAYLSGVIQPQLNYKLNDRISFDFDPNINFSLSPINKETAVKTYQNMFSVGAGVRIKL